MHYAFTLTASELLGIIALAILTGAGFTAWLASIVLMRANDVTATELQTALDETHDDAQARAAGSV